MNKRYNDLRKAGYQTTGICSPVWHTDAKNIVADKAKMYKVDGNKVAIVQHTEVTNFRDRSDKSTYWVALVLFTDEYKARMEAERKTRQAQIRQAELIRASETFTIEELTFMINHKVYATKES